MPKIQSFDELLDRARAAQQAIRDVNLSLVEQHDADELRKLDQAISVLDTLNRDSAEPEARTEPTSTSANVPVTADPMVHEQIMSATPPAPAVPPQVATSAAPPPAKSTTAAAPTASPAPAMPNAVAAGVAPAQPERPRVSAPERPAPPPRAPAAAPPSRPVNAGPPKAPVEKPIVTPNTAPTSFAEQIQKGIYTRRLRRVFVAGRGQGMVPITELPHLDGLPAFDNCLAPDDSPVDGAYGVFVNSKAVFAAVLRRPLESHRWQVIESIPCAQQKEIVDAVAHMLRRPTVDIHVD